MLNIDFYEPNTLALILFIFSIVFLVIKDRKKVERKGIVILWKTGKGKELIEKIAKWKYWNVYFDIGIIVGFILMFLGVGYLIKNIIDILKGYAVPSLALVLPSASSNFHFVPGVVWVPSIYWILGIALVILAHEPAHAIACVKNKIKIKSFGWVLLLLIPGAFVEPDEKQLEKANKRKKLRVFCAGSFSNLVVAFLILGLMHLFLFTCFEYKGLYFTYPFTKINKSEVLNISEFKYGLLEVKTKNETYFLYKEWWEKWKEDKNVSEIFVIEDAPSVRANLTGSLLEVNGIKIYSRNDVKKALERTKPNETIKVVTSNGVYNITLAENPHNKGRGYLGVVIYDEPLANLFYPYRQKNFEVSNLFSQIKDFFYWFLGLLSWISFISIAVAIINMLPIKPLDGGLTLESITSKKFANYVSILFFVLLLVSFVVPYFV